MVEFCPECSNLLRKRKIEGKFYLICKCGYKKEIDIDLKNEEKLLKQKNKALEKNLFVVSEKDKVSIYPIVKKICPKCGHTEAEAWQRQMRSADEPSTSFFRCTKCKHTWREY